MDGAGFVKRINELLEEKNISKKDFYSELNIANNSITAWGKKNQSPSADMAFKIAQYLNTTVEYLLTGSESNILAQENATLKDRLAKINELSKL